MGTKVTISPITNPENSSFPSELNAAIDKLADEFDKVIYRDGSFDADGHLDMGTHRIYNLAAPVNPNDAARFADILDLQGPPGADGADGVDGQDGADAVQPNWSFAVNTGAPGTSASLVVSGTYPNNLLTFTLPRGDAGASGALGDGTYGDITVSGTGSVLTIGNAKVTYAKMQNLASAGVIGGTAAGVPSLLSFATVKSNLSLAKADVGLGNVDNTSDANKPVSSATQTALNAKAAAFMTVTTISAATTLTDSHNNNLIKFSGTTARIVTLNSTPTAGFSAICAHRGTTASWTLSAASGIYLNGAASTVTSVTVAPGAHFTLIHEGSGVWTADGSGLT